MIQQPDSDREILLARGITKWFSRGNGRTFAEMLQGFKADIPKFHVLHSVDFTLYRGECVGIFGGNGSGKSTFLRCLAGVIEPNRGEVLALGNVVALLSHGFGAYEDLPVWRNMLMVLQILGATKQEALSRIDRVAAMAGLSDRILWPTSQLSEGLRAKISLCALAFTPFDVALLDESLNHVDTEFRNKFFELTREWIKEGRSLVITSHDEHLLQNFSTRQLVMTNKYLTTRSANE